MAEETNQLEKPAKRPRNNPPFRPRGEEWAKIRLAFIERPTRPSYEELASEFGIASETVTKASNDEGWPMLRAQRMEQSLREAGAGEIVQRALQSSRAIVAQGETFAVRTFQLILRLIDEVEGKTDLAVTTRANTLNTLTFAAVNVGQAMKHMGIVGLPKELANSAETANGRWKPELLQQINVTLHNISQAKGETPAVSVSASASSAADDI